MNLVRLYHCESAHQLDPKSLPLGHQCGRLHGHRYEIELALEGGGLTNGMIVEYADIDRKVKPLIDLIDHRFLNTLGYEAIFFPGSNWISGVINTTALPFEFKAPAFAELVRQQPTVEHLARWLAEELVEVFPSATIRDGDPDYWLKGVRIREDRDSYVVVEP